MKLAKGFDWHLRITLLPQCNLRCRYCNPKGVFEQSQTMDDDEVIDVVKAAVVNGITRIHWTGGEPCIRNVVSLFKRTKEVGMKEQIMTTNGSLKLNEIEKMKDAGLDRVNISLDTLNNSKYKEITGKNYFLETVKWIEKSCKVFEMITKMNIVPMKDNVDEIPDFINFAKNFNGKLLLKFIELCPNNPAFYSDEIKNYYVGRKEIVFRLQEIGRLSRTLNVGDNPNAEYYFLGNVGVQVILVTMPSQDFKCGLDACYKMRVSPYGLVGSCIQQRGVNLKGSSLTEKIAIIRERKEIRMGYSNTPPVTRKHLRKDYGIWRFGTIGI